MITADMLAPLGFVIQRMFEVNYPDGFSREELLNGEWTGWMFTIQTAIREGRI